jgi:hypothetical protein
LAILRQAQFPAQFGYLFDWFAELLLWCDGKPTWRDVQPWAAMMRHRVSPWEVRTLRRISDAYFASYEATVKHGD